MPCDTILPPTGIYPINRGLGLIGADGDLRIMGRDKDLVISGGYNVTGKVQKAELRKTHARL